MTELAEQLREIADHVADLEAIDPEKALANAFCALSDHDQGDLRGLTVSMADDPEECKLIFVGSEGEAATSLDDVFLSELLYYEDCAASCAVILDGMRRFFAHLNGRMEAKIAELGHPVRAINPLILQAALDFPTSTEGR